MALIKNITVPPDGTAVPAECAPLVKPAFVDKHADGQREGNRRNVAAILTQGVIMANGGDAKKAIAVFDEIHAHLVQKDAQ